MVVEIDYYSTREDHCQIPGDNTRNRYWHEATDLIGYWRKYQFIRKQSQVTFSDKHKEQRSHFSEIIDGRIKTFKDVCKEYKVEPIDREWLENNLQSDEKCKELFDRCSRRNFKGCPAKSLREII